MKTTFEKAGTEITDKITAIEVRLLELLPVNEIIEVFGEDTFIIGGFVRDLILEKTYLYQT